MSDAADGQPVRTLSRKARERDLGDPSIFSTVRSFSPDLGAHITPGEVGGYYIDFSIKTDVPKWPPYWLAPLDEQIHVATAQWGLGCHERFLRGEGDAWLDAAKGAADHLLDRQEVGGPRDGGWAHRVAMPHTYRLLPPWLSGMAQGEGASLLVRVGAETGEERYEHAALRALRPLRTWVADGGLRAPLGDGFFLEEYPTHPPSLVLNGGLFALWGCYDVGVGLGDAEALATFGTGAATLAAHLHRWDTGRWSLYDLFPHPTPNIASPAYHALHVSQLRAMELLTPHAEFARMADRFEEYARSRWHRTEAFARKTAFRLLVPRNALLAHRMPFRRRDA